MVRIDPNWKDLLSSNRFCRSEPDVFDDRGPFDRDYDRIIHSSNFRRLKDKTQVFPLSGNDFVRTRLTHSLEVSCIGRTLGRYAQGLLNSRVIEQGVEISTIVSSACLAHDIGNPPFGHSGEYAIQEWARLNVRAEQDTESRAKYIVSSAVERQDLHDFDGNAQSLRVVTRIQSRRRNGGLQLTHATIGAMLKYPCGSLVDGNRRSTAIDQKKCGYFNEGSAEVVAALTSMKMHSYADQAHRRHPLAFLVEAADDISNVIVDLEDTVDQKLITAGDAIKLLALIAENPGGPPYYRKYGDSRDELERARAYATNALVSNCAKVFRENLSNIFAGEYHKSLIDDTPQISAYREIRKKIAEYAYSHESVLQVEAAGFKVIRGLLDIFAAALTEPDSRLNEKLLRLFPIDYLRLPSDETTDHLAALEELTTYQRILAVTDYISGMTDSFAVDLFQKLSGIRL